MNETSTCVYGMLYVEAFCSLEHATAMALLDGWKVIGHALPE
jgi:hypothetical protein